MKNISLYILDMDGTRGNFLKYFLTGKGFKKVQTFSSFTECFYVIEKNHHPDFIIIDPVKKTETFLEFMYMVSRVNPYIRFIVFSTSTDELVMERFLEAGAKDYIHSSGNCHNLDELVSNVKFLLKGVE